MMDSEQFRLAVRRQVVLFGHTEARAEKIVRRQERRFSDQERLASLMYEDLCGLAKLPILSISI